MNELKKVVTLLKKSHRQPVIFHILHSHLAYIYRKRRFISAEAQDLWEKILIASVEDSKIARNSLDSRILQYLKGSRKKTLVDIFKLKIILYYMDSRSLSSLNMFILFELINYHYDASNLTNILIDSILTKSFLSKSFNIKNAKKISSDAVLEFLKSKNNFSYKRLPIYIHFNLQPPLIEYSNSDVLMKLKIVESVSFYANYTNNIDYFKSILPNTEDFLDLFKKFVCKDNKILLSEDINFNISKLKISHSTNNVENLKRSLRKAFDDSIDKEKFKLDISEFIESL